MAKSALTCLEEPWDHVEFDNSYDQQEAQRRSALNTFSIFAVSLPSQLRGHGENRSIQSIRFSSRKRTLRHSQRAAKNWRRK